MFNLPSDLKLRAGNGHIVTVAEILSLYVSQLT